MGENARLANIYIKIYNKQPLMMEDLIFLSAYDPECFQKTCQNLIYNVPEAKKLMEPGKGKSEEEKRENTDAVNTSEQEKKTESETTAKEMESQTLAEDSAEEKKSKEIEHLLENLKNMEWKGKVMQDVPVDKVKNLLGSLYMEMMFPHNDRTKSFPLDNTVESTFFNKKA